MGGSGGLRQLEDAPAPTLDLTLSQYHHAILADATREGMKMYFTDGTVEQVTPEIRERARAFMQQTLERGWQPAGHRAFAMFRYGPSVLDNGSSHTAKHTKAWLAAHPR
ncbi:hypothetical protein [Kitasatospora cinereorecta]|uniref:Uncharacterized protein n=1 Tax=Kitasatospora cinereorecta TaxID=285560 RepID=A0ABW0VEN8_9ACTN